MGGELPDNTISPEKRDVDALYDSLEADDHESAKHIIASMGESKNSLAVEPLTILLEYDDEAIRSTAAMALGKIGDKSATQALTKALKDPSATVQTNAALALGDIGDEHVIDALESVYITQEEPQLMNAVRRSVNRIKSRGQPDKKIYLEEKKEEPVLQKAEKVETKPVRIDAGSAFVGIFGKAPFIVGAAVIIILILIIGVFAYNLLFPAVWYQKLPYENSTGQYQSVLMYRNATDVSYGDLMRFISAENASIKSALFDDAGTRPVEYAARLHDDAMMAEINSTIVGTDMSGNMPGHAVVVFMTNDSGPVYVDPWSTNVSRQDLGTIDVSRVMFLRDTWTQTLPIMNANNKSVNIREYRNASPVTYAELIAFIDADHTEAETYDDPAFTCSDFAAELHDKAEALGIKCAVVAVTFEDQKTGHAFNAFPTTDKGIVFVDDTGNNQTEKNTGEVSIDGIVYLEEGQELGELPYNQTNGSLDYGYYLQRKDIIAAYVKELNDYITESEYYLANRTYYEQKVSEHNQAETSYSNEVGRYNAAVDDYNSDPTMDKYNKLNTWKTQLQSERGDLDREYNSLDGIKKLLDFRRTQLLDRYKELMSREEAKLFINHPVGVVKSYTVYW